MNFMNKAQGSLEYLVIITIIIIISLVLASILGFLPGLTPDVTKKQSLSYWQTNSPIAIIDYQIDSNGNVSIELKNNSIEYITVTEIYLNEEPINITSTKLSAGKTVVLTGNTIACTANQAYKYDLKIKYNSKTINEKYLTGKKPIIGICVNNGNSNNLTEFKDDTESEFNQGTYSNTSFNSGTNLLELSSGTNGTFESRIFNSNSIHEWKTISWTPNAPYGKELNGTETDYPTGNANLNQNVLIYHLNETSGTIIDSSGQGNNGTNNEAVYGSLGKLKTCLNFDGSNDIITGPSSNNITGDNLQTITFSAWVKHNYSGDNGYIASLKRQSSASTLISLDAGNNGAGSLGFLTRNNANTTHSWLNYDGGYNDSQWHHLTAVVNGLTRKLYIDGVERNSDNQGMQNVTGNTASFNVGGFHQSHSNLYFNGSIDEVAIWRRALSSEEILNNYKRGALNIKIQVRSCDDASCSGESFIGPDGTSSTYYSEINNSGTGLPSFSLTNVPNNQYFQYKLFFTTTDTAYKPKLKDITITFE